MSGQHNCKGGCPTVCQCVRAQVELADLASCSEQYARKRGGINV